MKRARPNKTRRRILPERYYKWLLPALGVAAAAAAFLIFLFAKGELKTELPADCYQMTLGDREEFSRGDTVLETETGLQVQKNDERKSVDPTPFYHKESRTVTLSQNMIWADAASHKERSIPKLSQIFIDENGQPWCTVGNTEQALSGGFLTDGQGTFVFLEQVRLTVNGVEQSYPALSFYSNIGDRYRVWSYGDAAVSWIEDVHMNTLAVSQMGYQVDLTAGIYTAADGSKRLLAASPDALPPLS